MFSKFSEPKNSKDVAILCVAGLVTGTSARAYVVEHLKCNDQAAQFVNLLQKVEMAGHP